LPPLTPRPTIREDRRESFVEAFRATLAPQEETMRSFVYTVAILCALALTAGTAAAEALGAKGQIALSSDINITIKSVDSDIEGADSQTDIIIAPGADFFIAPNLSVGGFLRYDGVDSVNYKAYGAGARVGYVIGLGKVSIWPRGGLALMSYDVGDDSRLYFTLNAYAPLLFHPVDHFFIGLGPEFNFDVYASDDAPKVTELGITSVVGGYF
jgi:hypothetical protein